MAGRLRYWKEKEGRFWARMAVPGPVQKMIGRTEIIEPLGGDRREALKKHSAAVTRLRAQITEAEAALRGEPAPTRSRDPITTADFGRAVWQRYTAAIGADETARAAYPTDEEIEAEKAKLIATLQSGAVDTSDKLAVLDASLDFLVKRDAAKLDHEARAARLEALKRELVAGDLRSQGSENVEPDRRLASARKADARGSAAVTWLATPIENAGPRAGSVRQSDRRNSGSRWKDRLRWIR